MRWLWWFLVLNILSFYVLPLRASSSLSDLFDSWFLHHGKTNSSEQEKLFRLKIFEENYAFITHHNSWSLQTTGPMEGINQIVTGSLTSLSEQELVDCDRFYNNGCEGGLMDYAFQFVVKNNGIDTEEDYPYQGGERSCN